MTQAYVGVRGTRRPPACCPLIGGYQSACEIRSAFEILAPETSQAR
jgi:hypothetical protein